MQEAMRFIQDNFKQVSVLKERNGELTEIVIDAEFISARRYRTPGCRIRS